MFQATLGPLIPVMQERHGLSAATAGLLVTGFFAGCLVSTAVGGMLSERFARRFMLLGSAGLLVVGTSGLVVPGPWPLPLVGVTVAGLGFGGLVLIVNTAMAGQEGQRGVTLVNLVNGTYGLGAAAGPALISLTQGGSYPVLFAVFGVVVLLTLPPRDSASRVVASADAAPRRRLDPTVLLFAGLLFTYASLETGLSSWEAVNLRAHGYSPEAAAALTSLFWLGLAGGRLLVPVVTKAWAAPRIIVTSLGGALAALTLLAGSVSAPVGFFLVGALIGPVFPTTLAWIARTLPNPRRVNAMVITAAMLGNASLPAFVGYGMQATSDLALPLLVALPVVACILVTLVLSRRTRVRQGV